MLSQLTWSKIAHMGGSIINPVAWVVNNCYYRGISDHILLPSFNGQTYKHPSAWCNTCILYAIEKGAMVDQAWIITPLLGFEKKNCNCSSLLLSFYCHTLRTLLIELLKRTRRYYKHSPIVCRRRKKLWPMIRIYPQVIVALKATIQAHVCHYPWRVLSVNCIDYVLLVTSNQ